MNNEDIISTLKEVNSLIPSLDYIEDENIEHLQNDLTIASDILLHLIRELEHEDDET